MPRDTRMPGLVDHGSAVVPSHLDQALLHLHGSPVDLDRIKCILMSSSRARMSCCRPSSWDFPSTCSTETMARRVGSNHVVHDVRNLPCGRATYFMQPVLAARLSTPSDLDGMDHAHSLLLQIYVDHQHVNQP